MYTQPWRLALSWALLCVSSSALAQTLAPITVTGQKSLSLPAAPAQARSELQQTAGAVNLLEAKQWHATQAATLKEILDYTPGVFVQPKWGADSRLSIRGSGLSRYYHLRGIGLYQDGIPLNAADGSSDFQWIDPTAYQYTEVYKGANALQYGAHTLGGAINLVSPSGYDSHALEGRLDTGSNGWRRVQVGAGFQQQQLDGSLRLSWQRQDGFREHSAGHALRSNLNLGWQLSPQFETRFYMSAARVRQEIPGSLTREQALNYPSMAAPGNVTGKWQHNIDGVRVANRSLYRTQATTYEGGLWYGHTELNHPIYQYLHHYSHNYGAYARVQHRFGDPTQPTHRLTLGTTWSQGKTDARNHDNQAGQRGALLSQTHDRARTVTLYGENSWQFQPDWQLITGLQFVSTQRKRHDLFNSNAWEGNRTGRQSYHFLNPKLGVLWQATQQVQVFANLSRSGEAPTFGDLQFASKADLESLQAQRATTFEIGGRGDGPNLKWNLAWYRANLRHEFQCLSSQWNICDQTTNIPHSRHQGIEAGLYWNMLAWLAPTSTSQTWLNLAYTWNDFHFRNDPNWGNGQIPGVPPHYLRGELRYQHSSGWYAGPNVEWVPKAYFVDNINQTQTAAYSLWGIRLGFEQPKYEFYLEGRNLANRKYIASASITDRASAQSALFEPGSGRSWFAGLTLRFD